MNKLLYIRQLLLSLNHVWEDNIATFSYFFITITEAARYRIIDTTGYTPFTPRSFEPADTMITVLKYWTPLSAVAVMIVSALFSMSDLDLIYISLRGKKEISMIFLNILIIIQGRITENLSLMQNAICALRIVNCHMTEPVIKEIMPSFRSFVFFETTDSADNLHAFLFISFPVICLN